jgi:putative ABC transport system permease protein
MRAGLTRQALRRHRWSLLGPMATQCVAAMVVSAMVMTGTSLAAAPLDSAQRRAVEAADVPSATVAFALIAVYLSILLVGVTMSSAVAQQGRDIALLRAVGATPGQVRRSVALQAAVVAVPASVLGYLLGLVAGWAWVAALVQHRVLPGAVRFVPDPAVLPLVVGILVGTSVVGGLVAAIRPARVRPATALTETATGRPRGTAVRTALGLTMLAAGVVLSVVISRFSPDQANEAGFFVMLAMCVGVGMLGPVILRAAAWAAGPVLRLAGGPGQLALDNVTALSRALSGALIPLVLAIAFAAVKVASHTTAAHVTGIADPASALWLDYSGTAVYCAFAAVAALNTLITVLVGRRRDLALTQLAGATRQRVAAVSICEAVIVAATALVLAAGVAAVTLLPLLHTGLDTWLPYLPAPYLAAGVLATAGLVAAGTVAPAAVLTRRPAIEAAEANG